MIKKYNLKTPITAVMWTGDNIKEVTALTDNNVKWIDGKLELDYRTSEGYASTTLLEVGDIVFKGSDGDYDCTDASRFNEFFKEIEIENENENN